MFLSTIKFLSLSHVSHFYGAHTGHGKTIMMRPQLESQKVGEVKF